MLRKIVSFSIFYNSLIKISLLCYGLPLDGRIVGGIETTIDKFPFQVSIQADEYPYHICGGSIIDDRWIITAAHCLQENFTYYVRVGSTYTYEGGQIYYASEIHNNLNFNRTNYDSDIALIKLNEPITISTGAKIINLPKQNDVIRIGSKITVSGWGNTMDWTITSDALRFVDVYVMNYRICSNDFHKIDIDISPMLFCASYPGGGKDACSGDSGGPAIYNGQLIGIVSSGYKCADKNFPGLYTNITMFRDWINNITGI